MRCDDKALAVLGESPGARVIPSQESDWGKEFLSLVAAVRVVDDLDQDSHSDLMEKSKAFQTSKS